MRRPPGLSRPPARESTVPGVWHSELAHLAMFGPPGDAVEVLAPVYVEAAESCTFRRSADPRPERNSGVVSGQLLLVDAEGSALGTAVLDVFYDELLARQGDVRRCHHPRQLIVSTPPAPLTRNSRSAPPAPRLPPLLVGIDQRATGSRPARSECSAAVCCRWRLWSSAKPSSGLGPMRCTRRRVRA